MFKNISIVARASLLLLVGRLLTPCTAATVTISWRSVRQDTAGQSVTSPVYYYVYRDTIPSFNPGAANFFTATTDTFIRDTDSRLADPATNLFYAVKALDAWGNESGFSNRAGEVPFVLACTRIWLQSTFDVAADSMNCSLRDLDLLPFIAPYVESRRHLPTLPGGMADWLLVQLLHPGDLQVAGQKSFILKSDGAACELDGANQVLGIPGVEPGSYHVRIRHRNHLAVTSHEAVWLNAEEAMIFDFTTDSTLYALPGSACPLKPGVWGLRAGDLNQDQAIDLQDYSLWHAAAQTATPGYVSTDLNFDGKVTSRDYVIWFRNRQVAP